MAGRLMVIAYYVLNPVTAWCDYGQGPENMGKE